MPTTLSRWNKLDQCLRCGVVIDADVFPFDGNLDWAKEEHVVIGHGDLSRQTRYFGDPAWPGPVWPKRPSWAEESLQ